MLRATAALFIGCALAHAEPPPLDAFFQGARLKDVSISPDGRYLALIARLDGKPFVAVKDRQSTAAAVPVLAIDPKEHYEPMWCHWANDTRILCAFLGRDNGRDLAKHYGVTRLVAVNADGSQQKIIVQQSFTFGGETQQFQDRIIDWTPADPRTVLIESQDAVDRELGVYTLDVYSGYMNLVVNPHDDIGDFDSDGQGNVRLGAGMDPDGKVSFFARLAGEKSWRRVTRVDHLSLSAAFEPIAVIPNTNFAWAIRDKDGSRALWKIDLEDKVDPILVYSKPGVDVSPLLSSNRELLAVTYEGDESGFFYTDTRAHLIGEMLPRLFPGRRVTWEDTTADLRTVAVRVDSDTSPPSFSLLDISKEKPTLATIGSSYPGLVKYELAPKKIIEYPAGDGTMIPGYLTLPVGKDAARVPLILMPHGGPGSRDTWGFDSWAQFLASRGYAVLQMNFRGSTGYGSNWHKAAYKDWGGLPYSDVMDGLKWAKSQHIGDAGKVCVVGASFGGYLSLLAATRDSAQLRCIVSIAGVSDLEELLSDELFWQGGKFARDYIGSNTEKLQRDSPRRHAASINVPVLLIHGDEDYTVEVDQTKMMDAALSSAHKTHKVVIVPGCDHYFQQDSQLRTLFEEMSAFLHAQLD
ncbi:MAG TPA: S9 family peptidase [Steroidobacteraceae bacterium]|nr:S9 family peptidase [Steroidobacteraceae bacterium]